MRRSLLASGLVVFLLVVAVPASAAPAPSVAQQLADAQKAGRPVYLLVSEPRVRGLEALRAVVQAARVRAPHVGLVEMDRSRAANRAVVKTYGLAGTRVPMVLVIAHNGAPGGGVSQGKKATERLLALLPSPRKADTLLALFQRKAAFVVVGGAKMPGRAAALAACRAAATALKGKVTIIEVGLADKAEQAFLGVLGADRKATDTVVHVYSLAGRKSGALKGPVTTEALVKAAQAKTECCPGGKCG